MNTRTKIKPLTHCCTDCLFNGESCPVKDKPTDKDKVNNCKEWQN